MVDNAYFLLLNALDYDGVESRSMSKIGASTLLSVNNIAKAKYFKLIYLTFHGVT